MLSTENTFDGPFAYNPRFDKQILQIKFLFYYYDTVQEITRFEKN
jgi:hypothetical protein